METPEPAEIQTTLHVVKSSQFRVVHSDGFLIQRDLRKGVRLTFYNDRLPFEEEIITTTKEGKSFSTKLPEVSVDFERELEVEISLSVNSLIELHNQIESYVLWLRGENEKDVKEAQKDK